jgi:phosphoribosylformylglycinamidine synthase
VDLAAERSLAELLREAVGLVTSAHDLAEGGLAQTLVEAALGNDVGVAVELAGVHGDPFVALFSESAARVLVTVPPDHESRLLDLADRHGVPVTRVGRTGGGSIDVAGLFSVPLPLVRDAWATTLPAVFA